MFISHLPFFSWDCLFISFTELFISVLLKSREVETETVSFLFFSNEIKKILNARVD